MVLPFSFPDPGIPRLLGPGLMPFAPWLLPPGPIPGFETLTGSPLRN